MVKFVSLYSGSDKNSSVFSYKDTKIMIDCGGSFKQLKEQLNKIDMDFLDLDAILITHSHTDHIKALPMIIKNCKIPIYSSMGTHEEIFDMGIMMPKCSRIIIYEGKPFNIDNIGVCCFNTPHDTKQSIGFNFNFGSKTATFSTDIGHIEDGFKANFKGKDFLFLESNHDINMLKQTRRPYSVINRILGEKGHLCNEASSELSSELAKKGLKRLMLGHLSGEANTPELAYKVTYEKLINNGIKIDDDILLKVAKRNMLSDIVKF